MNYKVLIKTKYITGIVLTTQMDFKDVLSYLNNIKHSRFDKWVDQDTSEDYFNDLTRSQFVVTNIKFNKFSGDLESVELLEE